MRAGDAHTFHGHFLISGTGKLTLVHNAYYNEEIFYSTVLHRMSCVQVEGLTDGESGDQAGLAEEIADTFSDVAIIIPRGEIGSSLRSDFEDE